MKIIIKSKNEVEYIGFYFVCTICFWCEKLIELYKIMTTFGDNIQNIILLKTPDNYPNYYEDILSKISKMKFSAIV